MFRIVVWVCFVLEVMMVSTEAVAQSRGTAQKGPVIEDYGPVYAVDHVDFATPLDRSYHVVFDVGSGAEGPETVNSSIETVARFLNMHARAGVPLSRMDLAVVLHGGAGKDALRHGAYRSRFGFDNPNLPLLRALADAGVRIILCGQTAAHRGFDKNELAAPVQLALSAMTALVTLQADGYELISF